MSKPGIIDPWRQDPPKPKPSPKGRIEEPMPDEDPVERCVIFSGPRAGLNVWVDAADDNAEKTAQGRVKTLLVHLEELRDPTVTRLLSHGALSDLAGKLSAETVANALRKILVVSPKAAALIARYKVKAFVK